MENQNEVPDDEALEIASLHMIRRAMQLAEGSKVPRRRMAAGVLVQAALAVRDTVKREKHPEVFGQRMLVIRGLLRKEKQNGKRK